MRVEKLIFTAGRTRDSQPLELSPEAITVFIGPNNGGKSTALQDIYNNIFASRSIISRVVKSATLATMPTNEFSDKMRGLDGGRDPTNQDFLRIGRRNNYQTVHHTTFNRIFSEYDYNNEFFRQQILPQYATNLNGATRLGLTNPAQAQKLGDEPLSTIAAIFKNNDLRTKISSIVHDAFGMHLVINATEMSTFSYSLSANKLPNDLERSFTDEAIDFFKNCEPVATSSDGTRAFIGVITEVLAGESDLIFIDEPEAFLHPGLAYALGREIALNVSISKQLFVATHSPDFLMGCISAGVAINVIRLSRTNSEASASLLDSGTLSSMMSEPLLRSSNVISGMFYSSAIVVEGDSDRAFYEEINIRLRQDGDGIKHPIFINAHGKHTAPEIARTLRQAGVPSAMILDLDWLKEDGSVSSKYFTCSGIPPESQHAQKMTRSAVRKSLEDVSANYKRDGGVNLLTASRRIAADDFFDVMDKYGLFTVRRGEVEAWLSDISISRSKQGWLERIFTAMGSRRDDPSYIHPGQGDVWGFIQEVSMWISNSNRRGMPLNDVPS